MEWRQRERRYTRRKSSALTGATWSTSSIVCLSVALERISLVLDFWTWAKVFYTEPAFDRANHIACIPCASVSVVSLALNNKVKNRKREHLFVPPINFKLLSLIYTGSPIFLIPYI